MTRKEILALKPGPELDGLLAEKLLGWQRHPHDAWWVRQHADGITYMGRITDSDDYYDHPPAWSPSRNLGDCDVLLEELQRRVQIFSLSYNCFVSACPPWTLYSYVPQLGVQAVSLEMAICHYCLLLLKEEKKL